MNCDETFNAGVCYVTDAYKGVCRFNEELHADLKKYRTENAKLRELVRGLVYATHPADRARLIADAAEFGIEVDG